MQTYPPVLYSQSGVFHLPSQLATSPGFSPYTRLHNQQKGNRYLTNTLLYSRTYFHTHARAYNGLFCGRTLQSSLRRSYLLPILFLHTFCISFTNIPNTLIYICIYIYIYKYIYICFYGIGMQ